MPPGSIRRVEIGTRSVAVFNNSGTLYALRDICPHRGARLSDGTIVGAMSAEAPGQYSFDGEQCLVKCPWHAWEFDLATGQSWCDPERLRVKPYPVTVERGQTIEAARNAGERVEGPYIADTVPIWVEDDYVVIDV